MSTQFQVLVTGALSDLGMENVPKDPPVCGGPEIFEVTPLTLKNLKVGTQIVVESDGSIEVKHKVKAD